MHCYRDNVNPTRKTNLYLFTCIEIEQHATLQVILEKSLCDISEIHTWTTVLLITSQTWRFGWIYPAILWTTPPSVKMLLLTIIRSPFRNTYKRGSKIIQSDSGTILTSSGHCVQCVALSCMRESLGLVSTLPRGHAREDTCTGSMTLERTFRLNGKHRYRLESVIYNPLNL